MNNIEFAVLALSFLFLFTSLWEICKQTLPPERDLFLTGYAIIVISLLVMTFTPSSEIYLIATVFKMVFLFLIIFHLDIRFQILEGVLIITLLMNIILRVTLRLSIPLFFLIILSQITSSLFIRDGLLRATQTAYTLTLEIAFALLFQTLVNYREKLVRCRSRMEESLTSLENLEAAHESFISHIIEIKEESAEEERNHITRELHDSLGYAMTNIVMMMNATTYFRDDEKLQEYCLMTKNLASTTMDETRNTLYRLRRIGQGKTNNLEYLAKLCREFQLSTGVETRFVSGNMPAELPERVFKVIMRAIQVGFINALKHGNTRAIKVQFWLSPTELSLIIWNDAPDREIYINYENKEEGIGLTGIRERLSEFNGSLEKRISPTTGFELIITIPSEEIIYE